MGTVSTALSEEELLECIESGLFRPSSGLAAPRGYDSDDTKCSVCQARPVNPPSPSCSFFFFFFLRKKTEDHLQEEYALGDEEGRLRCGHRYHMGCIRQWLRQKNWCPVCKSSASPSSKGRD